jgi:hypothetical protein
MFRRVLVLAVLALLSAAAIGCNGGGLCGCFRQEDPCCDPCGGYAGYEGGYVSGYGGDEFGGMIIGQ